MVRKSIILGCLVVLLVGVVVAQDVDVEPDHGVFSADSPLHGMEVAFDNMMVNLGVSDPSDVAFKRASEMYDLQERDADTPERMTELAASVDEHAETSVETAGGEEVDIGEDGISIEGPEGSVDISEQGISIDGPEGSVDIGEDGIDVEGPDGSVSIDDGEINVEGPDGSVSIDGDGIRVEAEERKVNIEETRVIVEEVRAGADGDVQDELQETEQRLTDHEQRLEQLRDEIEQRMEELRDR